MTTATAVTVSVLNDAIAPTVAITAPAAGATVSGTVAVNASASDNIAVAGVQFFLDGASLGSEILGPGPAFSVNWSTITATNGTHTLSARARDTVGNVTLAANVVVTVSNQATMLVGYAFSEGSGTTTKDSSGNGVTGTLSGATWTTAGKYGNALSFNGTSAYVNLGNPNVLKGTGSMSWAAWVYATGNPPDDGNIISKSSGNNGWEFKTSPDTGAHTFAISVTGSTGVAQRNSVTVRALNTWYHVAAVYNTTTRTLDIYVNGVLDNGVLTGTIPTARTVPNQNVNIGRRTNGFNFKGILDEVRVYDRALTQSVIQAIMKTSLP